MHLLPRRRVLGPGQQAPTRGQRRSPVGSSDAVGPLPPGQNLPFGLGFHLWQPQETFLRGGCGEAGGRRDSVMAGQRPLREEAASPR